MPFKSPSIGREIQRDAGTPLEGTNLDADDYSEWLSLDDCEFFGIALAFGTITGTSPTLDVSVEFRLEKDGNVWKYPGNENLETVSDETTNVASLAQIGDEDDTNFFKYWRNVLPSQGKSGQIRFFFDTGGTTPVFPVEEAVLIKRGN